MAKHCDTARIFQVEESPCCKGRFRVTLGDKNLCLDWREAKSAARAMRPFSPLGPIRLKI